MHNYRILIVYSTVVFCYIRACNICPYFTSGYFFWCTVHARNNEIDWEGTGGRSLLLVLYKGLNSGLYATKALCGSEFQWAFFGCSILQ